MAWNIDEMMESAEWRYMSEIGQLESDLRYVLCRIMGLMSPYSTDEDRLMAAKATVPVLAAADQVETWGRAARDHAHQLFRPVREGQAHPSQERIG